MSSQVHFKIVLIDETPYYGESTVEKCGARIMRAFLFDSLRTTNACELRSSYTLIPLRSSAACKIDDDTFDRLFDADADDNDIKYMHANYIDSLPADRFYTFEPEDFDGTDEVYAELEVKYEEDCKCNEYIACPWSAEHESV